jgi:cell fate regulator YaaT (PSP1 superfamily)
MHIEHLVRIGLLGHVGRFQSVDAVRHPRGARVVCRTARGLEIGEVLTAADRLSSSHDADGELLRRMTVEDELLSARLDRRREEAYRACNELLAQRNAAATLLDVEQLFDGRSLFFYFLGETNPEIEQLTGELAAAYESEAQLEKFADLLTTGCGPGCGTEEAEGAGCGTGNTTGGCSTCAVGCGVGRR